VIGRSANNGIESAETKVASNLADDNALAAHSPSFVSSAIHSGSPSNVIGSSCKNDYHGDGGSTCNSIVNKVNWTIGDENKLQARVEGDNTLKSAPGAHYYRGAVSVLGSNLHSDNMSNSNDGSFSQVSNRNLNWDVKIGTADDRQLSQSH
jgi:hypothetical protein